MYSVKEIKEFIKDNFKVPEEFIEKKETIDYWNFKSEYEEKLVKTAMNMMFKIYISSKTRFEFAGFTSMAVNGVETFYELKWDDETAYHLANEISRDSLAVLNDDIETLTITESTAFSALHLASFEVLYLDRDIKAYDEYFSEDLQLEKTDLLEKMVNCFFKGIVNLNMYLINLTSGFHFNYEPDSNKYTKHEFMLLGNNVMAFDISNTKVVDEDLFYDILLTYILNPEIEFDMAMILYPLFAKDEVFRMADWGEGQEQTIRYLRSKVKKEG